MSVEVYSECAIQHANRSHNQFYRRCLIELRQHDIGHYSLRAIDLEQNKRELFDISLRQRHQYVFHPSAQYPDTFNSDYGQYQILLNPTTRDLFHNVLRTCLEAFLIVDERASAQSSTGWEKKQKTNHFLEELTRQADEPYYRNDDPFECVTCMEQIEKGEGVLFRHCLHPSCRDCVLQMIRTSEEPTIKCPHNDCSMLIEERELRAVVQDLGADPKLVDRLLDRSVGLVEAKSKTFHCLTPDCKGWWFVEPEGANALIHCNVCRHWICLACKAIHEGITCKDYQSELKLKESNDANAKRDAEHLQALLQSKEILACPGCQVLIQKISGCDWIQCSQCKLEICWPTRGPRWGPGGRGDISGGCRCRVNGVLCVPNCGNCH